MSDRGGGVAVRKIDRLFNYMYSTAPRPRVETSRATPLVCKSFIHCHLGYVELSEKKPFSQNYEVLIFVDTMSITI